MPISASPNWGCKDQYLVVLSDQPICAISALQRKKLRPVILKVSVQSQCTMSCVFSAANSKLTICDMIKKQKRGEVVICNGKHTDLTCFNSLDISN